MSCKYAIRADHMAVFVNKNIGGRPYTLIEILAPTNSLRAVNGCNQALDLSEEVLSRYGLTSLASGARVSEREIHDLARKISEDLRLPPGAARLVNEVMYAGHIRRLTAPLEDN